MLTVHIPPKSQSYIQIGVLGGNISSGTRPWISVQIRPFYGPFGPDRYPAICEVARQIEGRIWDYKDYDPIGDKSVRHHQVEGDLFLVPFATTDYVPPTGYKNLIPGRIVNCGSVNIHYTHLAPVGTDLHENYSWSTCGETVIKGDTYGTYYVRVWHHEDGRCGYGWFKDAYTWDGRKYVHSESGNLMCSSFENTYLSYKTRPQIAFTDRYEWDSYQPVRGSSSASGLGTKRYNPVDAYTWVPEDARLDSLSYITDYEGFPPCYVAADPNTLGDLAQRCVDQQEYVDINTLGYVNELRSISSLIPKIGNWRNPKTWGSLWLWFKYGVTLSVSDSKRLLEAIDVNETFVEFVDKYRSTYASNSRAVEYGGWSFVEESRYKLTYDRWPSNFMEFIRKARNWNLWPKLETAWDMVPLSFVIDWVVDVQSLLARLDTYTDVEYFNVISCCWSRKVSISLPAVNFIYDLPVEGNITFTLYERHVEPVPRLPNLRLDDPGQFKNYLELASLIVTRR